MIRLRPKKGKPEGMSRIDDILDRALAGRSLAADDLRCLLACSDQPGLDAVFAAARELRRRHFGNKAFLYGFVYFSTYCQNDCAFCYYRCSNGLPPRYRKGSDEVVQTSQHLAASGVHLIDLTMGEDAALLGDPQALPGLVRRVRQATGLPVMASPGVLDAAALGRLAQAGASWYALYQETYAASLFARLRLGQSFQARIAAKRQAASAGLLLEEGLLAGVGESVDDLVESLQAMQRLNPSQVRAMTYIPQAGTTAPAAEGDAFVREQLLIAVLRLLFPDRLIPASLDVEGLSGLAARLDAGANVVTSIIPPRSGLAGVAHATLDVEEGNRTVAEVLPVLAACGMQAASAQEYKSWLADERQRQRAARETPINSHIRHSGPDPESISVGAHSMRPPCACKRNALIVGGRLQGIELAYLAGEAGWRTTLVDRRPAHAVPASGLADCFVQADVADGARMLPLIAAADIVLPAVEDSDALAQLLEYGQQAGTDVACDLEAYRISSSKSLSNSLFARLGLPQPAPWPQCGFPAIVKPDGASGSQGVRVVQDAAGLAEALAASGGEPVIQRYLPGRSWSMEVIGNGRDYRLLPITEVVCGADFDSERIVAPAAIGKAAAAQLTAIGHSLAQALKIDGIFDIEVISDQGQLQILEIDARFPSQTPLSIYYSHGINMVSLLAARHQPNSALQIAPPTQQQVCLYQQVVASHGQLQMVGEHALAQAAPLSQQPGFFGADLALTNWRPGATSWQAIVIVCAPDYRQAEQRYQSFLAAAQDSLAVRMAQSTEGEEDHVQAA